MGLKALVISHDRDHCVKPEKIVFFGGGVTNA